MQPIALSLTLQWLSSKFLDYFLFYAIANPVFAVTAVLAALLIYNFVYLLSYYAALTTFSYASATMFILPVVILSAGISAHLYRVHSPSAVNNPVESPEERGLLKKQDRLMPENVPDPKIVPAVPSITVYRLHPLVPMPNGDIWADNYYRSAFYQKVNKPINKKTSPQPIPIEMASAPRPNHAKARSIAETAQNWRRNIERVMESWGYRPGKEREHERSR